jgi:hypothetical protein
MIIINKVLINNSSAAALQDLSRFSFSIDNRQPARPEFFSVPIRKLN